MIFKRSFAYITLIILSATVSLAKKAPAKDELLLEVEGKYSKAQSLQANVSKELFLSVLKKKKTSTGKLNMASNGRFRLELTEPTKSLIIMNGKDIWVVEYPDPSFQDDKIQVLHSKFKDQLRSQVLLSFLMGQANLQKHFKIDSKREEKGLVLYSLLPKEETTDLKKVLVSVDSEAKTITYISYTDALDNEIKYVFKDKKFGTKVNKKIFNFTPPKNADVSEIN